MIITEFNSEEIEGDDEMSELLSQAFEEFCEDAESGEGMTRPIEEEDDGDVEWASFMWTDKAIKIIEAERNRLHQIGIKYFPDGDICIESYMFREP